ncbi:adenylyltransferase/cytidyltransferase family protein [Streptomyces venezuelae]|uniref:adenylyltransferase/cytidyltransferase family protein n=1 Tax=Streptomyces venezuelae TaxID=54571 RepID=UPI0037B1C28D
MRALFPGSFDPVTQGHEDILRRAALLFDEVVVCVMSNAGKTGRFPVAERLERLRAAAVDLGNVTVDAHTGGLLVDYCGRNGIDVVVRAVRGVADLHYEVPMARMKPRTGRCRDVLHRCGPRPGPHLFHSCHYRGSTGRCSLMST